MNYKNYKYVVIEHYSIELKGWPLELLPVRNPSHIGGCKLVQVLINALTENTCKWTKLSEEELIERIASNHAQQVAEEIVYKVWKKCAQKTVEKSTSIIESSSESDESDRGDVGNE